jgi:hypothetical protein
MTRYSAYLIQAMSTTTEFETDDPNADLVALAVESDYDLSPHANNGFETDGDVQVFQVINMETGEVVYTEDR